MMLALVAVLTVSHIVLAFLFAREIKRLRAYQAESMRERAKLRADLLAAEARARGVGGRGEHGAPMVTRLSARSLGESIPTGGNR